MPYFYVLLFLFFAPYLSAQKVLLLETANKPQTVRYMEGDYIRYRLNGDPQWYGAYLYELRPDIQQLAFQDRYVALAEVAAIKRGRPLAQALGYSLMTFGASWSGFALIGTATDGNPDTGYRWSDAVVSGISLGSGFLLVRLWGNKRYRFGKGQRHRLRIVDISF